MPLPLPLPCKGPHGAPLTLYVFLCKADSIDIRCRLPLMRRNRMWLLFGRPAQTLVDRRRYSDVHTEWGKYAHTGVDTQALCMGGPSICWPGGGAWQQLCLTFCVYLLFSRNQQICGWLRRCAVRHVPGRPLWRSVTRRHGCGLMLNVVCCGLLLWCRWLRTSYLFTVMYTFVWFWTVVHFDSVEASRMSVTVTFRSHV